MLISSKVVSIIGQKKAFGGQGIPGPSFARKENADKYTLITSRNGDRKKATYQNNQYTYDKTRKVETVRPVQKKMIPTEKTLGGYNSRFFSISIISNLEKFGATTPYKSIAY